MPVKRPQPHSTARAAMRGAKRVRPALHGAVVSPWPKRSHQETRDGAGSLPGHQVPRWERLQFPLGRGSQACTSPHRQTRTVPRSSTSRPQARALALALPKRSETWRKNEDWPRAAVFNQFRAGPHVVSRGAGGGACEGPGPSALLRSTSPLPGSATLLLRKTMFGGRKGKESPLLKSGQAP